MIKENRTDIGGAGCLNLTESTLGSLSKLYELTDEPLQDILDYALEESLKLSGSAYGFIFFYNERTRLFTLYSWSKTAMANCSVRERKATFELEKAGWWGDVVHTREPIVVNDYLASNPSKKGLPDGHVQVHNFMSVPVFHRKEIVAVFGVANKTCSYTKCDLDCLRMFAQGVWTIVSRLQAEEELKSDSEMSRIKYVANLIPIPLALSDAEGKYLWCNVATVEFLGMSLEQFAGKTPRDLFVSPDHELIEEYNREVLAGRQKFPVQVRIKARGEERRHVVVSKSLFKDSQGQVTGFLGSLTDITHIKRLKKALAAEAVLTNTILEHAPVGIAVYDVVSGECVRANRFLADLLGGTVEELKAQNFREVDSWRESGRAELAERALSSRAVVKADKHYRSTFGKEVFLECTFASIETGGVSYLLRVDKDISARKRMEKELKEQLTFVQTLVDAIPSPVYMKDTSGRYVWCNKAYRELRGGMELSGRTAYELLGAELAAYHAGKETEMYARGVPIAYEYITYGTDGEVRQTLFNKAPVVGEDGSIKGLIGVMTDITERMSAETKLRESEETFRKILLGIQAGILIIDPETFRIVDANPVAESILGASRSELVGRPCTSITWVRENNGVIETPCPLLEGNILNEAFVVQRPDGVSVPILKTVVSALRAGKMHLYEVIIDMTARKALERQLALAQRLESIGGLAAGIAHEINTPIQYIGDNLSFLEGAFEALADAVHRCGGDGQGEGDDDLRFLLEETPKALAQSQEGVTRVADIVRAMKRFSYPGGEDKSQIDVPKAIENTVLVTRNEWKYHADIRLDLDPGAKYLMGYAGDFSQALLNVVVNASHAINDKYKNLDEKGTITIRTKLENGALVLAVADTGCGIPDNNLHRVFDPFFTTKEVGKGTGQGLAIVHDVMRKHGGTVSVESVMGQGTTFFLRFPLPPEEGAKA